MFAVNAEKHLLGQIHWPFTKEHVCIRFIMNILIVETNFKFNPKICFCFWSDTGERPYPCTICDKTFARHETAIIHLRTHTGEKPHICQICHRGFISSGHLTGHMRSHNGIKTHECNICRKRFASSSSLKVHMKMHMDKGLIVAQETDIEHTVYECNVCKRNIPLTALKSSEELHAFNHQIIDSVLICSNVTTNSADVDDKHMAGTQGITPENMILSNIDDAECIDDDQQIIISLSDIKD